MISSSFLNITNNSNLLNSESVSPSKSLSKSPSKSPNLSKSNSRRLSIQKNDFSLSPMKNRNLLTSNRKAQFTIDVGTPSAISNNSSNMNTPIKKRKNIEEIAKLSMLRSLSVPKKTMSVHDIGIRSKLYEAIPLNDELIPEKRQYIYTLKPEYNPLLNDNNDTDEIDMTGRKKESGYDSNRGYKYKMNHGVYTISNSSANVQKSADTLLEVRDNFWDRYRKIFKDNEREDESIKSARDQLKNIKLPDLNCKSRVNVFLTKGNSIMSVFDVKKDIRIINGEQIDPRTEKLQKLFERLENQYGVANLGKIRLTPRTYR